MATNSSRLQNLIDKYAEGKCDEREFLELMQLLDENTQPEELDAALESVWNNTTTGETSHGDKEKTYRQIKNTTNLKQRIHNPYRWINRVAAAIFLTLVTVGTYYAFQPRMKDNAGQISSIQPGTDKAILTLADGSSKILDNSGSQVFNTDGVQAIKSPGGKLSYKGNNTGTAGKAFHELKTPPGGQYQLILSDGTKVWLNAATTLRFPASFGSEERLVELTGEAYFEVAKDKTRPFRVNVNNSTVEVLGTHFNIMGYADENSTNTTLLEGAVKIIKNSSSTLLKPGEQATVGTDIGVSKVDVNHAVQWQKGNFDFSHEKINTIMRKIARWYNVKVEYKDKPSNETFNGIIPRSKNISDVLHLLELTNSVHFKVEERRVIVMP